MDHHVPTQTSGAADDRTGRFEAIPIGRIGGYSLLRELGEGGMGTVYLAHQAVPVERDVALKVIKQGMDTREVLARFEAERQALAVMNHTGIARVFDGGVTDDGRPFFAMELVDGEPITQFCDRHRLPIDQRIALVAAVCKAVQHAHQKGVIHRDLKPSNIPVTMQDGKPWPKVIDFGIAKAVREPLTDRTFATQAGVWIGTPAYMSPEQLGIGDLDVDTRSDIYSLGVVLYELLAGVRPFDDREAAHGLGMIDALRRHDVPPPATRLKAQQPETQQAIAAARQTHVAALQRQLATDLGWIVGKAIDKDRARRYETVNSLAADLERYLANEPVIARAPSRSYRMRKFVSRHRAGVAGAAAILALILASTGIITAQAARVTRERDRATLEAARATSINQFLRDMLASANPWGAGSRQMTVVDALAAAERRVDSSLAGQPDVALAVKQTIGEAYSGLGEYKRAEDLMRRVVDITRANAGRRVELAGSLMTFGGVLRREGRLEEAATALDEAVTVARSFGEERRDLLASAWRALAEVRREQGRLKEAETLARDALDLSIAVHGPVSDDASGSYDTLANVMNLAGDSVQAEKLSRQAIDIKRQLRGPDHPEVALAESNLGVALLQRGDFEGAVPVFEEAVRALRQSLGEMDAAVAVANENLANALMRLNRLDESAARLEEVLRARRAMLGYDSMPVGRTLHNLGVVYTRAGAFEKAETTLSEARRRLERALGPDHPEIATVIRNTGLLREKEGKIREAEALYRESLERNLRQLGANNPSTATARAQLAKVLVAQRRYAEAEAELVSAHRIREGALGATAPLTRTTADALAKLYDEWGKPDRAAAVRAKAPIR